MTDENSEFSDSRSTRPFYRKQEEKNFIYLFNNQKFRPITGVFSVFYKYPNNLFFKPIPAKDKVIDENRKIHDIVRFRNGTMHDNITSVDIQEIVRCGGRVIKINEGIVYTRNMVVNPFNRYIRKLFNLRLEYKKTK